MPIISVIIPIYNVEKYIERCLDSVCNNKVSDIEIICVDDGSTDRCGIICKDYSKRDSRIKVIHKKNGGVSSARNVGINISTGKYIYFIDPDDDFNPAMLLKMVNIAEQEKCEVVLCGYKTIPDENIVVPLFELNKSIEPQKMIMSNNKIYSHNDLCFSWRFLFRKNIIEENNIRFNENIFIGEDAIFNLEVLLKCSRVYVLEEPLYYYTINNEESKMKARYKKDLEASLITQYDVRKRLSKEYGLYKSKMYNDDLALYYINTILPMMIVNIYNGQEKDKRSVIKRILKYRMFQDSCEHIGFSYKCNNLKEYIIYLAIKYKLHFIIYYAWNKSYK